MAELAFIVTYPIGTCNHTVRAYIIYIYIYYRLYNMGMRVCVYSVFGVLIFLISYQSKLVSGARWEAPMNIMAMKAMGGPTGLHKGREGRQLMGIYYYRTKGRVCIHVGDM